VKRPPHLLQTGPVGKGAVGQQNVDALRLGVAPEACAGKAKVAEGRRRQPDAGGIR